MSDPISFLRASIMAEIKRGEIIDVDRFCRVLAPARPELSEREIKALIIALVGVCKGGAVWGVISGGSSNCSAARPDHQK